MEDHENQSDTGDSIAQKWMRGGNGEQHGGRPQSVHSAMLQVCVATTITTTTTPSRFVWHAKHWLTLVI
jgi:hypothetical protein